MPNVKWEWSFGPQVLISIANFLVLMVGVVGLFYKMQADIASQRDTVSELKLAVRSFEQGQLRFSERLTAVETKTDIIMPAILRIEQQVKPK